MKQIQWFTVLLLLSNLTYSQGIRFEQGLNWGQVLAKAKKEHKDIFVDCYATWCGPCKLMDAEVYPNEQVGKVYNSKFISVKVQMDRTKQDNEEVKNWYGSAKLLQDRYNINSFPTFLFFDENGNPIHKVSAAESVKGFIELASDALNPEKQYFTIVKNFQPGKLDTAEEKSLAMTFAYSDKELSSKLALDYLSRIPSSKIATPDNIHFFQVMISSKNKKVIELLDQYITNLKAKDIKKQENKDLMLADRDDSIVKLKANEYINSLSEKDLYAKENAVFIYVFTLSTNDRGFALYRDHTEEIYKADPTVNPAASRYKVKNLIYLDEIKPFLTTNNSKPDWPRIEANVKKYGNWGDSALVSYKPGILFNSEILPELKINPDWNHIYQKIQDLGLGVERSEFVVGSTIVYYLNHMPSGDKQQFSNFYPAAKKYDELYSSFLTSEALNNWAWAVFLNSNDSAELRQGLAWSERSIATAPSTGLFSNPILFAAKLDTKANLLYKLGRKEEAIELETKASQTDLKGHAETLQKMKSNLPTWPTNK